MTRRELPNRRPLFIAPIAWAGVCWAVGVGLDPAGEAAEVWADPADPGVDDAVVTLVHEAAITASHLLQAGTSAAAHAKRLDGNSPGLLALMLRRAAEVELEHGGFVRTLHEMQAERARTGAVDAQKYLDREREGS